MTKRLTRDSSKAMTNDADWKAMLGSILADFGCQTGTIHQAAPDGQTLTLVCQIGVPESLMDKISTIPFGKGIAGAAAERGEPVDTESIRSINDQLLRAFDGPPNTIFAH